MLKPRMLIWTIAFVVGATAAAAAQEPPPRPTLAIVEIVPGGWTVPPPQLGEAIARLLMDELVSSSAFHVMDGEWLVPEEEVGRATSVSRLRAAAEIRNLDYVVIGTVTAFSTEHHVNHAGGVLPLPFLLGGFARQQTVTTVGMTFRIVDVRTGEITWSVSAHGQGSRRNVNGGAVGIIYGVPVGAVGGKGTRPSRDAMLDEALRDGVKSAAHAIVSAAPRLTAASTPNSLTSGQGGRF